MSDNDDAARGATATFVAPTIETPFELQQLINYRPKRDHKQTFAMDGNVKGSVQTPSFMDPESTGEACLYAKHVYDLLVLLISQMASTRSLFDMFEGSFCRAMETDLRRHRRR